MNILLNFFPVQSGGGQQVASNLLKIIANNNFDHNWFLFVGKDSELHRLSLTVLTENQILAYPYSYFSRINSISSVRRFVKENNIDIIYNYAPVLAVNGIPQVVRSVYSNLYFPEIPFWNSNSKITQLKKKVIDHFRLKGTLKADGLMFENESMLERAVKLFNYPKQNTIYIAPSVSSFEETENNSAYENLKDTTVFKILYLSSWHLNKNIHILPDVALNLRKNNVNIKFILSLNPEDKYVNTRLVSIIKLHGLGDYFDLIGKVEARYVHQVVKSCDAMILLSKLECFSSNVMEAFYFEKPIIISDEEWSRAACHNAGIYVLRDDIHDISEKIIKLIGDQQLYQKKIEAGIARLKGFNIPEEKVVKQVEFLERIYDKYKEHN